MTDKEIVEEWKASRNVAPTVDRWMLDLWPTSEIEEPLRQMVVAVSAALTARWSAEQALHRLAERLQQPDPSSGDWWGDEIADAALAPGRVWAANAQAKQALVAGGGYDSRIDPYQAACAAAAREYRVEACGETWQVRRQPDGWPVHVVGVYASEAAAWEAARHAIEAHASAALGGRPPAQEVAPEPEHPDAPVNRRRPR
jgi:hypothetical protein